MPAAEGSVISDCLSDGDKSGSDCTTACPEELQSSPDELVCMLGSDSDLDNGPFSAFGDSEDDDLELWDVIDDPALDANPRDEKPEKQPTVGNFSC